MIRMPFASVCAAMGMVIALSAKEFPLQFHTIDAKDVMAFPGGYGLYSPLRPSKPAGVKKEPKAVSGNALYGECRSGTDGLSFLLRLDESLGDGKGYDRLIVDMNRNGDLTDDPVAPRVELPTDRKRTATTTEQVLFGPLEGAADKRVVGGRPVYFAQAFVYNRQQLKTPERVQPLTLYLGQLRLKAGWYLDTTVDLNGVKQRVGIYDADVNLSLGDLSKTQTYKSGTQTNWYFRPGDMLLVDHDGSGAFENDPFQTEACVFSPIVYFGTKPFKVALAANWKSLGVEPWKGKLAEVTLSPRGKEVREVTLAWEQPGEGWQPIRVGATDGRIQVPPGRYRFYACSLLGEAGEDDSVMASASQRVMEDPVQFKAGSANELRCGGPLEIEVAADKRKVKSARMDPKVDSEYVLRINGKVLGVGGEVYSSYGKGPRFRDDPPNPTFTITDSRGRRLANGNLEFG